MGKLLTNTYLHGLFGIFQNIEIHFLPSFMKWIPLYPGPKNPLPPRYIKGGKKDGLARNQAQVVESVQYVVCILR